MRRVALWIALLAIAGVGACRWLLPDEFVVNGDIAHILFGRGIDPPEPDVVTARLRVPEGLQVTLWAEGIPNARMLRFTPAGDLLVSQPRAGRIVLVLADRDGDGLSDGRRPLIEDLDRPHGLDLHEGWLYLAEAAVVSRVRFVETGPGRARVEGGIERVVEGLPKGGNHWTRTLGFGPDGGLYLSIGSSCNACEEDDPRRAALMRFEPDGSGGEIFATGLRNAVGFDWHPESGDLYATDNGRDLLGDDFPPCELNRVVRGGFYGWPYANGDNRPDPRYGEGRGDRIADAIPPVHGFRAHNAPLGITFVRQPHPPGDLAGAALVALHGSWNRSEKDGYEVVSLHWREDGTIEERAFLTGFEHEGDVIGRPVDVAEGPDGAFYVSDDYAGVVYRVGVGPRGDARRAESGETTPASSASPAAAPMSAAPDPLAELEEATRVRLVDRGEALFRELECGGCHLPGEARAEVVVKPLVDLARRYDLDSLSSFFLSPQPPMPAYELSEEARRALAAYAFDRFGRRFR